MSRSSFAAGIAAASLVSATLASGAFAATAPTGDAFTDAITQTGSSWTASPVLDGATIEPGEIVTTDDAGRTRSASVWLRWTAPQDASIALHATAAEHAAVGLALFSGSSLAESEELVFSAAGDVASLAVTAGTEYYLQVSSLGAPDAAAPADVTVALTAPAPVVAPETFDPAPAPQGHAALFGDAAPNNSFALAQVPTGDAWSMFVNNDFATTEVGERVAFDEVSAYRAFKTVWIKWVAPATGTVTIDTYGSDTSETSLAVFTGTKVSTAVRIAVNDDAALGDQHSRITSLAVTKGIVYAIQVGSVAKTADAAVTGSIKVALEGNYLAPANNDKGRALAMAGNKWVSSASTIGSTIEPGFEPTNNPQTAGVPRQNSVWWKWTALANGTVNLTSLGTTSTIYLAAFEETPSIGIMPVAFDRDLNSHSAALTFETNAGSTYYFQAGDLTQTRGTVALQFVNVYSGPYIGTVAPASGKLAGGNTVTITGSRMGAVTKVTFGGVAGTNLVHVGDGKVVVKVPAGAAKGKVVVVVWSGSMRSMVIAASHYTYV